METMSKAEEAREDAEVIEVPPPTYEASVAGESELYSEHDYHVVEAGPSASNDEKRPLPSPTNAVDEKRPIEPAPEFFSNEKSNPDSQAIVPYHEEELRPALPVRPSSITSTTHAGIPLSFTLSWRRALFERKPYFDCPALSIVPTNNQPLPASSPGLPTTSHWQLNYEKKYFARLHRYAPEQAQGDIPYRQVAEISYPDFMWPNGGVKITFEPHEEEISRRGSRHVSRTDKMMVRQGWWSAKYGIDLPVLGGSRVEWVNAAIPPTANQNDLPTKTSRAERLNLKPGETHLVTVGEVWEDMKRKYSDDSWSPYPVQNLVEEVSGRVLAVFTRARPMQKLAGRLEILPPRDDVQVGLPEYIEGIVVACAAMVGMKDRMGIMSSLVEAGTVGSRDMPSVKMPDVKMPNLERFKMMGMGKKRRDSGVDEVEKGEVEVPPEMPPRRSTGGGRFREEMGDENPPEKPPRKEVKFET
ncbi:hypothetical protein HII31_00497 [Pseudocercospora fuligena]|uniref:Uncharacterized protein n=1 Tax=Pseudocercospora fuligena TaxID=685502 RepID=A0A8H6RXS4_9PEZI|nr:hypothetical protein HII31_00497 [Pseudocercospora fuligena]